MEKLAREVKELLGMKDNVEKVKITPEVAGILLEMTNKRNRKLSNRNVTLFKSDMAKGIFRLSNDMVTFNRKGILTNGQHRLTALALSNTSEVESIEFFVSVGDVDNFMGMDTGKTRSIQDNFSIFESGSALSDPKYAQCISVAKDVCSYCNGTYHFKKLSQEEYRQIVEFLEADLLVCYNSGIFDKITGITNVTVMSAYFLAYKSGVDIEILRHIHSILKDGITNSDYDKPIIALRDKLVSIKGGGRVLGCERLEYTMDCICKVCKKSRAKYVKRNGILYTYKDIPFVGSNRK